MAIWQYDVSLIPTSALAATAAAGASAGPGAVANVHDHLPICFDLATADLEGLLSSYLPPRATHERHRSWGDDERDDADAWYRSDGQIASVRARLDLRDITRNRVRRLADLARAARCCFLDNRTGAVIPATEDALIDSIHASRSAAFVADPRGFLDGLSLTDRARAPDR